MPLLEAEFWVAVGFFLFVGVLTYFGIPQKMLAALDSRGARIKAELDDARRLRDEAEALLAEYKRKRQAAEAEAGEIVASARAEAERVAAEAKARMEEFVARRSQVAEAKIAQAETHIPDDDIVGGNGDRKTADTDTAAWCRLARDRKVVVDDL